MLTLDITSDVMDYLVYTHTSIVLQSQSSAIIADTGVFDAAELITYCGDDFCSVAHTFTLYLTSLPMHPACSLDKKRPSCSVD